MFPLDQFGKQTHFLLCPYPPSCPFCLPAGPAELIEVHPVDAADFSYDAVTVKGTFRLMQPGDNDGGLFYSMDDAQMVK